MLKIQWSTFLIPLLNNHFRGIAIKLKQEERDDFDCLKQELQDNVQAKMRHADVHLWTLPKSRNWSAPDYIHKLNRMAERFLEGDDRTTIIDSITKHQFIHELPKKTRQFVCEGRTAGRGALLHPEERLCQLGQREEGG